MRIALLLKTDQEYFPLNHNYSASSAIYSLLRFGSPEFSSHLHNIGYRINGKNYKLFTFALRPNKYKIEKAFYRLESPYMRLFVSSAMNEEFFRNFILGSFKRQTIDIVVDNRTFNLSIEQMEELPSKFDSNQGHFILKPPIVISTKRVKDDVMTQHYFRYYDDINEISRVFNSNLINKYNLTHHEDYSGQPLNFSWDYDFINKRISNNKKVTKLIQIKRPRMKPINIIANDIPFTLEGDNELINTGIRCGFGEKNSMGFGYAIPQ
ncbi:MAG: CRISPR-associated endoribonuclease Cas6 [Melioribacteraceae bacterium]|nr:CRISPR-associated endoribonuclease Cas6 [Melioribacteraceae bacterium]